LPQNEAKSGTGQRSGVTSDAPDNLTITNLFQTKKKKGLFDVPKLFLASCVQHVYEGLLIVDKTFLPV
jgi:hypothetical protein